MRPTLQGFGWTVTLILSLTGTSGAQTTWYVDANAATPGNGTQLRPYASIQYAIDQPTTLSGDTLLVAPGVYHESVKLGIKGLVLRSSGGPAVTTLVALSNSSAISIGDDYFPDQHAVIEGFTIQANQAQYSAVVTNATETIVRRCILLDGAVGVYSLEYTESTRVENCTFVGCLSAMWGDIFACGETVVDSCLFLDCDTDLGHGGGWCDLMKLAKYCAFDSLKKEVGWQVFQCLDSIELGVWNPAQGDVHLKPLSACIDRGNPMLPPDPDGSRVDIGALPYDPQYATESPTNYCTGKRHSAGCVPHIEWFGTPSLSGPEDFILLAREALNGMPGKFIWSSAPKATPFGGGTLCVAAPFVRGPLLASGGEGTATNCSGAFVWPISHAYMQEQLWEPGQILYAQAWGRDIGSALPEKSQLSDAIVFQVLP